MNFQVISYCSQNVRKLKEFSKITHPPPARLICHLDGFSYFIFFSFLFLSYFLFFIFILTIFVCERCLVFCHGTLGLPWGIPEKPQDLKRKLMKTLKLFTTVSPMQERWIESELLSVLETHLSITPVSGSDVKQAMSLKMEVGIDEESSSFRVFISNTGRGPDHRSELLRPPRQRAAQPPAGPAAPSPACSCEARS